MTRVVGLYVEGPLLFYLEEFVELTYEVSDKAISLVQSLFLGAFNRDVEIVEYGAYFIRQFKREVWLDHLDLLDQLLNVLNVIQLGV